MIAIIWRYRVAEACREEFERAYGPGGAWASLFGKAGGYVRTDLLSGDPGVYFTVDCWRDADAWQDFQRDFGDDYARLDSQSEVLTDQEERIGLFTMIACEPLDSLG